MFFVCPHRKADFGKPNICQQFNCSLTDVMYTYIYKNIYHMLCVQHIYMMGQFENTSKLKNCVKFLKWEWSFQRQEDKWPVPTCQGAIPSIGCSGCQVVKLVSVPEHGSGVYFEYRIISVFYGKLSFSLVPLYYFA